MSVGVKVQVCGSRSFAEGASLLVIERILDRDPMEGSVPSRSINLLVIERKTFGGHYGICPYPRKRHDTRARSCRTQNTRISFSS